MSFENDRLMGQIGALLVVVSPFAGSFNSVLAIVGLVLLLVAFNGLAEYYKDRSIFKNVVNGAIIFAVGAAITAIIVAIAAAGALSAIGLQMQNWTDPAAWQSIDWNNLNYNILAPYFAAIIVALVILFAFTVAAAYFIRKSFITLAQKSGIAMFATSGLVLLIGAILIIILVGILVLWIAMILLAIAFFRLREQPPLPASPSPSA